MKQDNSIPVLGFIASSGTGKTTLLTKLIPVLKSHGFRVGVIKYTHHDFEVDQPGKDSYELRKSGAVQTLLGSELRWALMTEYEHQSAHALKGMLSLLDHQILDIILVEGYKQEKFPKIELHRIELDKPLLYPDNDSIIAIACNGQLDSPLLPLLDINNPDEIAEFIISRFLPGGKPHPEKNNPVHTL